MLTHLQWSTLADRRRAARLTTFFKYDREEDHLCGVHQPQFAHKAADNHTSLVTMLTLQKAFCQLRLVVTSTVQTASSSYCLAGELMNSSQQSLVSRVAPKAVSRLCMRWNSSSSGSDKGAKAKVKSYDPPSPYRTPGPRRYGYEPRFFTGGLLPRGDDLQSVSSLPKYKVIDKWDRKRALFGQNDYIDILGDRSVKPVDLINGPDWLIGFKGNELQRLVRRLNFHGEKLKLLYPHKYHNIQKRIFFLYKKYNRKRGKRVGSQRRS
ncbi:uncharacterized protein LOC143287526 [Babylonia areolata]|uniref:uncharacterized protein LOC143287526 n=1 Tax=Babylonia areolata TaxID=304850 RepID=UPI003FCFD350